MSRLDVERWVIATLLWLLSKPLLAADIELVSGGAGFDYQPSVVMPWQQPEQRVLVFERLTGPGGSGDLWLTRSSDGGHSWTTPVMAVASAANERHPALVQTGASSFVLLYLKDEGGNNFRIHRAVSSDGLGFTEQGRVELGWPSAGEINPHLIRHVDGTLTLSYHRLGGAAYIAQSGDGGLSWDLGRTQLSPANAALPRVAFRESDQRYLVVYQVNPGNGQLQLKARSTQDVLLWDGPEIAITSDGNNHDALPLVLADDRWLLSWTRVVSGSFQIHTSTSADGVAFSEPVQRVERAGFSNVQPHPLLRPDGTVELYWGGASTVSGSDYDILRLARLDFDAPHVFADGFEAVSTR